MAHLSSGIIGLPNAGKSTLFNALTKAGAAVAAYPFCTIEANVGIVPVFDSRVDRVAELAGVKNVIYRTVEYVDVAGLVKNASKGEGRGNEFLDTIRRCDALVHVVRCFEDSEVAHVHGVLDPVEDMRTVNIELILADLQMAEKALERFEKSARHDPSVRPVVATLERIRDHLDSGQCIRTLTLSEKELDPLRELRFLSDKSVLYVANLDEASFADGESKQLDEMTAFASAEGNIVVTTCAKLEAELANLEEEEARMFLDDMGITEPGLPRLVGATSELLGLVCFLTFNENEARAWTVPGGTTAQAAAGVIHTDFAKNFIRAEVTAFEDFDRVGGKKAAHEQGLMRIEGRDYIVQDGDVIYFRIGP